MQSLKMALKSIASNKMRSMLTMLGIIIGVAAVITMVSLVEGTTADITASLESMGTNMISVNIRGRGSSRSVTADELIAFGEKNSDTIAGVAPSVTGYVTAKVGSSNVSTTLEGTNAVYVSVRNTGISDGRFISDTDVKNRTRVAVIGKYIANQLFFGISPIGQTIYLNGDAFKVVGVMDTRSSESAGSTDDCIFIPYTTASRFLQNANIRSFYVEAAEASKVDAAVETLETFMYERFQDDSAFSVFNQAEMLATISETTGMLSLMLGGIAGISLFVGGIGIMNIMLVSVTERTREIGIRKAVGARRRDILVQFLIEAIVVSCLGGIIGILVGFALSNLIGSQFSLTVLTSPSIVMLSFTFSAFVGIFFGYYPAAKASKLSPIEALRTE